MKISLREIRDLYHDEITARTPSSRRSCPSVSQVIDLLRGGRSTGQRARILNHLLGCGSCLQEFEGLRLLGQQRDICVRDLSAWLARQQSAQRRFPIKDEARPRGIQRRFFWRYALALASLLLGLIFLLDPWRVFQRRGEREFRAGTATKIRLIHPPANETIFPHSLFFQWSALPQAEYYFVELFDPSLVQIWKSNETQATKINLPSEVARRLLPGTDYYWLVTAIRSDDKKVESDIGLFRLKAH